MTTTQSATEDTKKSKAVGNGNGNPAPVQTMAAATEEADDFESYNTDRAAFKPEVFTKRDENYPDKEIYTGLPIQGYVLAFINLGTQTDENGDSRPGEAYIVRLTKAAKASNRDKKVVDLKPGDEVLVWANAQIKQAIPERAANHPTLALHIRIKPLYRAPMPTDPKRRMWTIDISGPKDPTKKLIKRSALGGGTSTITHLLNTNTSPVRQLGRGGAIDVVGEDVVPSDLPF